MQKPIILREYQSLVFQKPSGDDVEIRRQEWDEIWSYVLNSPSEDGRRVMDLRANKITARNYVGVIQTSKGTTIEILPKVGLGSEEDLELDRDIFLRMLRRWRDGPFRNFNDADVRAQKNFPLLEAFIGMFIKDMRELTRRGLACAYHEIEENRHTLKGKLLIAQNLRHNLVRKDRFYVRYEEFSANRPINRLLKSTLLLLQRLSRNETNLSHIRQALLCFEDLPESANIDDDLTRARVDRTMPLYNRLFPWARLFLKRAAPTTWEGNAPALALLFPMERIFEDYATYLVRMAAGAGWKVRGQENPYCLMDKNPQGEKEFRLRPDIVARWGAGEHGEVRVMDAKWKRLSGKNQKAHYGINQSDLYQMYAYGKKYQAGQDAVSDLYLLYPRNRDFNQPLEYEYETGLRLTIFPVDLREEKPLFELLKPADTTCPQAA